MMRISNSGSGYSETHWSILKVLIDAELIIKQNAPRNVNFVILKDIQSIDAFQGGHLETWIYTGLSFSNFVQLSVAILAI